MKICSQCGAQIPDGEVFCPECGKEVQLVPDYETMGSRMQQEEERRKAEEEQKRLRRQEEERLAEEERQRKKKRTLRSLIILAAAVAAAIVVIFFVRAWQEQQNYNSFDYQLSRAETAYSNNDYDSALEYVTRALALNGEDLDARMLLAQIYEKNGDQEKAIAEFLAIVEENPDYEPAYGQLIRIYEEQGLTDQIKALLDNCESTDVLEYYSDYICAEPSVSPAGGSYDTVQRLTITAAEGTVIYYTLDGSDPDTSAQRYTSPVQLPEGHTTVKAVAVNERGISSDIVQAEYTITLAIPSAPSVTPASGSYTSETTSEITVEVPEGYTAYYAFDQRPDKTSTRYTGPVPMMEGEHIFYVVLENQDGQLGRVASRTYIYEEIPEPTPTPTSRPTSTPTPTSRPTSKPTVTAEPTPTPTNSLEPTPTAEPTPEPTDSPDNGSDTQE